MGVAIQFQKNGKPRAVNVEYQSSEKFVIDTKKYLLDLIAVLNDTFKGRRYPQQVLIRVCATILEKSICPMEKVRQI